MIAKFMAGLRAIFAWLIAALLLGSIVMGAAWMEWGKYDDCRNAQHSATFCTARSVLSN